MARPAADRTAADTSPRLDAGRPDYSRRQRECRLTCFGEAQDPCRHSGQMLLEFSALAAEAIHAHGALAGLELYHGCASSPNGGSRTVRLAPSQLTSGIQWGGLAKEMDTADIAHIQLNWVQDARRARDVGFDIVYVYG